MPRNEIIVGLDDSPSGRAALRTQHALTAGSPPSAIHVVDWPYSSSSAVPATSRRRPWTA